MEAILEQQSNTSTPKAITTKAPFFGKEPLIQRKLSIGASNDVYEQEADAMADKVVSMSTTQVNTSQNSGPLVQRKCAACEEDMVQKKPLASEITPMVQRKSHGAGGSTSQALTQQISASRGGGHTMDRSTQSFMENGFGTDFSNVRIHTGPQAIQMSNDLRAQAFTVGNDIYFNEGKYNPTSTSGKHLLAHELTHTIQQKGIQRKIQKKADPCTYSTNNVKEREIHLNLSSNSVRVYQRDGEGFSILEQFDNLITGPATWDLARQNGWCHMYSIKGHQNLSGMGLINFVNYCGDFGFHSNYWRNGTPRPTIPTIIPGNRSHGCARIHDDDAESVSSDASRRFYNMVSVNDCVRIYARDFWREPTFARCPSAGENCSVNAD